MASRKTFVAAACLVTNVVPSTAPHSKFLHPPKISVYNIILTKDHKTPPGKKKVTVVMARRVPLNDVETAIKIIEQDGGVILTGFSKIGDVEKVNRDAAPFITAIQAEVSSRVYLQASPLSWGSAVLVA